MSKAQKPLKPDDFPVKAEGKKIEKQRRAHLSQAPTTRPLLPRRFRAPETRTKPDAKKISGQPRSAALVSGWGGRGELMPRPDLPCPRRA